MGDRPRTLGTVLRAIVLSGLLAGGALALFHSILTEPVVDQAIAFEAVSTGMDIDPLPLVSRQQQKVGLIVGSVFYGIFLATIFGGVFYLSQESLPPRRAFAKAALLALAAYWLIGLFPFLKYPATRPASVRPRPSSTARRSTSPSWDCRWPAACWRPTPPATSATHASSWPATWPSRSACTS